MSDILRRLHLTIRRPLGRRFTDHDDQPCDKCLLPRWVHERRAGIVPNHAFVRAADHRPVRTIREHD